MRAPRDAELGEAVPQRGGDARRRIAIEAAMLAFLLGLALVFVVGAPS